ASLIHVWHGLISEKQKASFAYRPRVVLLTINRGSYSHLSLPHVPGNHLLSVTCQSHPELLTQLGLCHFHSSISHILYKKLKINLDRLLSKALQVLRRHPLNLKQSNFVNTS